MLTISIYELSLEMARYSPSWEKLKEVMAWLVVFENHKHYQSEGTAHSQDTIVRAAIHSVTSNRFTMESWPPEATYL